MPPSPTSSTSSDQWSDFPRRQPESQQMRSFDDSDASSGVSTSSPPVTDNLISDAQLLEDRRQMLLDQLRERQYWTSSWKPQTDVDRPFKLGDPSTLGELFSLPILATNLTLQTLGPAVASIQLSKDRTFHPHRLVSCPQLQGSPLLVLIFRRRTFLKSTPFGKS